MVKALGLEGSLREVNGEPQAIINPKKRTSLIEKPAICEYRSCRFHYPLGTSAISRPRPQVANNEPQHRCFVVMANASIIDNATKICPQWTKFDARPQSELMQGDGFASTKRQQSQRSHGHTQSNLLTFRVHIPKFRLGNPNSKVDTR